MGSEGKLEILYDGTDSGEAERIVKDFSNEPHSPTVEMRTYDPFPDAPGIGMSVASFEGGRLVGRNHILTDRDLEILAELRASPNKFENLSDKARAELSREDQELSEQGRVMQEERDSRSR